METVLSAPPIEQDVEKELIDLARRKNRPAFDQLFHIHKHFIYNVCYRMLGSSEDAADAVQTAFIQAYKSLPSFKQRSGFRTWLYRIAINVCLGVLRTRRRNEKLMSKIDVPERASEPDDQLWEAILMLPGQFRSVLVLFYFEQLSTHEVAEALGCSELAVRTRLCRARSALKAIYEGLES